jgi:hypothetical protein
VLDNVRALVPGGTIEVLEVLGSSPRSQVHRVRAGSQTLIVKEYLGPSDGWARESAALSVMPAQAPVPRLVGASADPPIVVMTDAGSGASVADALLGSDPAAAADAVASWATAMAALHRVTAGRRDAFRGALADRSGGGPPTTDTTMPAHLDKAAAAIAGLCAELDVDVPPGSLDELRGLAVRLDADGPAALTLADACPDNNAYADGELVLFDFEEAEWRHIAWDVAYLTVPWPSCWCAWRLPEPVTRRAIEAYRTAANNPYVDSPGFRTDLAAATTGWSLVCTSWFLPRALRENTPLGTPRQPAPTRQAATLYRLDHARRSTELPALAELAGRLHDALTQRWGPVPLAAAPAFR